jgi:hypothetical protein
MGKELKRMRYFDGLFLNAEDYKLDQEYQRRLTQLHNRYMHTWGIIDGLEVSRLIPYEDRDSTNFAEADRCTVVVSKGLAQNQVINQENGESISQQIYIFEGHPECTINLLRDPENPLLASGYSANEAIYIYVSYKEELADKDNLEKGKGQEIHIWESGHISHCNGRPSDEKKCIILARVLLKLDSNNNFYIEELTYNDSDGITPVRTYAGPAGSILALEKIIFKQDGNDDLADMPYITGLDQGANGIGLEVNSLYTHFNGSVNVKGDLLVNGSIENTNASVNELSIANCFVQVNTRPEEPIEGEEPWKARDGGLQVYRGQTEEMPDATFMWSENDQWWKIGLEGKLWNIAYGPKWERLIKNDVVDDLHRHTNLCYATGETALEAKDGNILMNGNVSLDDKTVWFRKDNSSHGLGWFGFGKQFAGVEVDGPVLFGLKGGILGSTEGGQQKSVLTWNSTGNVGIGVQNPIDDKLEVNGSLRILSNTNPIRFTSKYNGSKDVPYNYAEISNDISDSKALVIMGNKSAGGTRKVAIWDRLDVNGYLYVNGDMKLAQALTPSAGSGTNNGINFPNDPGGGSGDAAWLRYYARSGEACNLVIGTSNDGDDNISLMASGNVGVGTVNPADKLDVSGWMRIMSDSNPIRFTSAWSGFPDKVTNQAEICNDTNYFKSLMIAGNKSAGGVRKVSIWDSLDVNGSLKVNGNLTTTCAIVPSVGSGENNGISFPRDAYGGSGDAAWIRYYSDLSRGGGENMTLEIGISNDSGSGGLYGGGDRIRLYASGGVYVSGYFYYSSSRDLKENITTLSTQKAKKILDGLNPVTFNFKGDTEKTTMGFIAEEVPQAVAANDQKAISPMEIVAVLTSVVKDQRKAISALQQQVEAM